MHKSCTHGVSFSFVELPLLNFAYRSGFHPKRYTVGSLIIEVFLCMVNFTYQGVCKMCIFCVIAPVSSIRGCANNILYIDTSQTPCSLCVMLPSFYTKILPHDTISFTDTFIDCILLVKSSAIRKKGYG